MDDIEDLGLLVSQADIQENSRYQHDGAVLATNSHDQDGNSGIERSPYLDHSGRVFVKTWGCSHNSSDSEYMKGLLHSAGYDLVDTMEQADICVLNSCTVKDPSESVFVNAIRQAENLGVKVVLAGCVPQADSNNKLFQPYSIIGVKQIDRIVEVVSNTLQGNSVRLLNHSSKSPGSRLQLPKIRRNQFIEILPINTGCLNHCTYCKTKQSRGQLSSYSIEEIVDRVKTVSNEGVREIWLTSEDLGAYGHDIGTCLSEMLSILLSNLPDHIYIRLGMTNPPHILSDMAIIAQLLNHPRIFSFIHIPVQAGSSRVLDVMGRDYTRQDFQILVDYLLSKVPDLHIATDIICGFPTETDMEFQETLSLIDQYRFPSVHISQFYARRGTSASHMRRLPSYIIKDRSRACTNLFYSYQTHDKKVGREYNVLCTEMAHDMKHVVAHNKSYDQILVAGNPDQLLGKCFRVRIISCDKFHMIGDIIHGTITHDLPLSQSQYYSPIHTSCMNSSSDMIKSQGRYRIGIAIVLLLIAVAMRCLRLFSNFY